MDDSHTSPIHHPSFPDVQGVTSEASSDAGVRLKAAWAEARDGLGRLFGRAGDQAKDLAGGVDSLIAANRYPTLGVGFTAGLVLGGLIGFLLTQGD